MRQRICCSAAVIFRISLASWNASSVKKTLQSMLIPIQGELFLLRFSATCLLTKLREKLEEKMASVNRACTGYMWFAPRFDWLMFRSCVRLGGWVSNCTMGLSWERNRSVTSRYLGSKISGSQQWEIKQRRRWRQRERQKSNNFARASRFFVHFLAFAARPSHETS